MIEVNMQCHSFGKRLCWALSSLAQQTRRPSSSAPWFRVSVAYAADEPGPWAAAEVLKQFERKLWVVRHEYPDMASMMSRGATRDRAARQTECEWLFYADCDAVYHPSFMDKLGSELLRLGPDAEGRCMWSPRRTMAEDEGDALVGAMPAPCLVGGAFAKADKVSKEWSKPRACVGNTQIARTLDVRARGGYSPGKSDASWLVGAGNTRSDVGFRKSMAGCVKLDLPDQIHLNHKRDAGSGRHLTEQR